MPIAYNVIWCQNDGQTDENDDENDETDGQTDETDD